MTILASTTFLYHYGFNSQQTNQCSISAKVIQNVNKKLCGFSEDPGEEDRGQFLDAGYLLVWPDA